MSDIRNKLYLKFESVQFNKYDQGIRGSFEALGVGRSQFKGSFKIPPKNRFKIKFDVSPPPRKTIVLDAVKDVYVYEGNKTFNYGLWGYLQVGVNSEGLVSRSFIDFDFTNVPSNIYITRATLILYSKTRNSFEGLELSTADREYIETNVVWGNQPVRKHFISVHNIEQGAFRCTFDVTDIVKNVWYGKNHENHGFLLKSYDETTPSIEGVIHFFSKESIYYKPQLEIEYFEPDLYQFGSGSIEGKLEIVVPIFDKGISGDFEVYKEKDVTTLTSYFWLVNPDMINADLYVPYSKDIQADFHLWNTSKIDCNFTVLDKPDRYPELDSYFHISYYDSIFNMYYRQIDGLFRIPDSTWMFADFYVAHHSEIYGDFILINSYINGYLNVVNTSEIQGRINFVRGKSQTEIKGSFIVSDIILPSDFTYIKCDFYVANNTDLNSDLFVPNSIEISGDFELVHYTQLIADLYILKDAKLNGYVYVVIPAEEKGIRGSFQTIAQTSIYGNLDIKQDRIFADFIVVGQKSLNGSLFVPEKKNLKGDFVIWKSTRILGRLEVTPLAFTDLFGSFYLDGRIPIIKSYGFII